ncbi:MAG: hypothetical protein ACM3IL_05125 [Deltaproteobacteria bacterium]
MVNKIDAKKFSRYGWVIDYRRKNSEDKKKNLFQVILTENKNCGWRIGYLVVRDKSIDKLEQHPHTFETFEPVKGRCLLYLADLKDPDGIDCFYLDRPVILKKGVWHGLVTVGSESEIKITENARVRSVYWPLGFRLNHR